jgi:hypothetical protein
VEKVDEPPSTSNISPVMNDASSESRKSTAEATSSVVVGAQDLHGPIRRYPGQRSLAGESGVVDEQVQGAETLQHPVHGARDAVQITGVRRDRQQPVPRRSAESAKRCSLRT